MVHLSEGGPVGPPRALDGPSATYKTLHEHKTISTAETVYAYGLAMMCNAVHMHKQLTWINMHSLVNTQDTTRVPKTICVVNTWNAFCLCLNMLNG